MSEQNKVKSFKELRYSDSFMFGKVMENPELCRDVLECLLQRPVGELREVQTEKEFRYTSDGKPIRLDVCNLDSNNELYDTDYSDFQISPIISQNITKSHSF